ncbi:CHAD domain-containing protein [Pseudoroseomonas cervicalis]|uniref:CHAD domain-containing protein n=1 Tax=Teichococcus cervicalis TaxID=204525 RepID=UPI00277ED5C5|nr:CHAD domain-containing protein [Pseudoroseomonas cervicalis]MDQ1078608.1 triphosphatase [Pseudoroseomonas cervicalis]
MPVPPVEPPLPPGTAEAPPLTLELQLEGSAQALWRHAALAGTRRGRAQPEEWLWLDSADRALRQAGQALRAPPQGSRALLPLQPPGALPLPGLPAGPQPLPEEAVPAAASGQALLPIASYAGQATRLMTPQGVSLLLRQGVLRAARPLSAGAPTLPAPEAVPERAVQRLLLQGPPPAVLALALALAADLPLLPALRGLDEAALALAEGEAEAPARRGPPDLGGTEEAGAALALAIAHVAGVLLSYAPLARPEAGPTAVHQLRVAARRLRSCLKLFRPLRDSEELRRLDAGLRDLARTLGAAREWDVFLGGMAAELGAALGPDPRWSRLLRRAEERRDAAYARLAGLLRGPQFRALIWQAMQEALQPSATGPATPLRAAARAILARRRRKLMKRAAGIAALSDEALHALRLEAKRLRYAAELFAPLWPGKASRRYIRRLSALQEALGLSNDGVAARGLMQALAERDEALPAAPAWAVGLVEGWALASARGMREAALDSWRRFARQDPFWTA